MSKKAEKEWVYVVQESREYGGGLVVMARGSKEDMEKLARKGGMALPVAERGPKNAISH